MTNKRGFVVYKRSCNHLLLISNICNITSRKCAQKKCLEIREAIGYCYKCGIPVKESQAKKIRTGALTDYHYCKKCYSKICVLNAVIQK